MIARVAAFEGIDVAAAQATMDEATAVIRPIVQALPGYEGSLELATYEGKFLSITFFDSQENAAAAESTFDEELPAKLGHIFEQWAGRRASVDLYQVVGKDGA